MHEYYITIRAQEPGVLGTRRTCTWPRSAVVRGEIKPIDTHNLDPVKQQTRRGLFSIATDGSVTASWSAPGRHAVCCRYAMYIAQDTAAVTVHAATCDGHVPRMDAAFPSWAVHVYRAAYAWTLAVHDRTFIAQWRVSNVPKMVCTMYSAPRGAYYPYELSAIVQHTLIRVRIERQYRRATVDSVGILRTRVELPLIVDRGTVRLDCARLLPHEAAVAERAAELADAADRVAAIVKISQ